MPGKGHKSNVYLNLSNGYESLRLYVYTISTSDDLVRLIQMRGKQIRFGEIPKYPKQIVYYKIGITNKIYVLKLDNGRNLKLPNYILVPITQIRMFDRIVKSNYKIRLYIGNGIYRKLRPIWVEIDLRDFGERHINMDQQMTTNQETDSGFQDGFVQVAVQTSELRYPKPKHQKSTDAVITQQVSNL